MHNDSILSKVAVFNEMRGFINKGSLAGGCAMPVLGIGVEFRGDQGDSIEDGGDVDGKGCTVVNLHTDKRDVCHVVQSPSLLQKHNIFRSNQSTNQ